MFVDYIHNYRLFFIRLILEVNGQLRTTEVTNIVHISDAASGWAGWALAHPEFGSSVNPTGSPIWF
jgi:hypothetical protein